FWQDAVEAYKLEKIRFCERPTEFLDLDTLSAAQINEIFETWGECLSRNLFLQNVKNFEQFCELTLSLNDAQAAISRTQQLHQEEYDGYLYTSGYLRLAHVWAQNSKAFVELLENMSGRDDLDIEQLNRLHQELEKGGWVNVVQDLVAAGHFNRLVELSKRIDVNLSSDLAVGPPSALLHKPSPIWLDRFPAEFHPAINTLNSFVPPDKALSLTENVLGKSFPDPAELSREIQHLEGLIKVNPQNAGLSKRFANLKKRQTSPKALSSKKVDNLNKKLVGVVHVEMLNVWEGKLKESAYINLSQNLNVETVPDELVSTHGSMLLPNIRNLPHPFKDLGLKLLQNRCGARPWLMSQEPANLKFVGRLSKLGINVEPWLNPPEPQKLLGENDQEIIINFEDDPIEILHMGGYFNTCLSPGSFNFYSTTINAADINKHVIFGRNSNGSVVGRCLIGLTDQGGIVTFHPYCHDGKLGFEKIILKIVQQLATEMGTIILPKGIVEPIMANDWYDDGPRDLAQSFVFLNHDSTFRKNLESISPGEFVQKLGEAFSPLPLNGLTLPLIIDLHEVQARPALLAELLPFMRRHRKSISDQIWFKMLKGLIHLGRLQEAREIVLTKAVPYQLRYYRMYHEDGYLDFNLLDTMIDLEPVLALQVIRQTRSKYNRTDLDEWIFDRAQALIKVYGKLNRPNKRKLLEEKWSEKLKKRD
ncbi:MAG: hypothetical protein AAGD96_31525, partial [Chloroflexota bacterium]